ncbi:unnamed protein product [Discula destructiva]
MWTPSFFPHLTAWIKTGIFSIDSELREHGYGFPLLISEFRPEVHIFALVGILVILYVVERAFDFVLFHFAPAPRVCLQGYKRRGPQPTYALVTGASAGIGLGIAKALVKQGFGVIILGHKEDELAAAASELRAALVLDDNNEVPAEEYVKTIVMDAATVTPEEMEETLRAAIVDRELRVSILVNNVGSMPIALPPFRDIATYSPDDIDRTIALNARFPVRLTTLMLPVIAHRGSGVDKHGYSFGTHRRSLILNISSAAMAGFPYVVLYSATKAFNWSFSRGLARELERDPETNHIDVLGILPGDVQSQGNMFHVTKWSPNSDMFGQYIVAKVEKAIHRGWREMHPFWLHHLEAIAMGLASEKTVSKSGADLIRSMRNKWEALQKSKGD